MLPIGAPAIVIVACHTCCPNNVAFGLHTHKRYARHVLRSVMSCSSIDNQQRCAIVNAQVRTKRHMPTALCAVPEAGGATALVVGDDAGNVFALDARMLGQHRALWSCRPHAGPAAAVASWAGSDAAGRPVDVSDAHGAGARRLAAGQLVATAGKDGAICLLDASTGELLQRLPEAHYTEKRSAFALFTGGAGAGPPVPGLPRPKPAATAPAAVTGLSVCEQGLVSSGLDGVVMLHPFV